MKIIEQHDFYEGRLIGAEITSNLISECEFVRFATGTTVQKMQDDLNDPNSKLWNRLAEDFDDAGWDADGYEVLLTFSGGGCFVPLRDVEEEATQLYFNHRYFARYTKFEDGTMEWDLRLSMNGTLVQVYHDVVATADESVEVRRAYAAL